MLKTRILAVVGVLFYITTMVLLYQYASMHNAASKKACPRTTVVIQKDESPSTSITTTTNKKIVFPPLEEEEQDPNNHCPAMKQLKSESRIAKLLDNIQMNAAFVTFVSTENYVQGARALLHSFRRHNKIKVDFIAMVVKGRLSSKSKCMIEEIGWKIMEVDAIPPPRALVYDHFNDQFTKLQIFSLTQYDKIFYADCDTVIVKQVEELFLIPGRFAATNDWFQGMFKDGMNAGVFVAEPSKYVYERLMYNVKNTHKYGTWGEQDYFNWMFGHSRFKLPAIYNANKAIFVESQGTWDCEIKDEVKIIHYTMLPKPFYDPFGHTRDDPFMAPWWEAYDDMEKKYPSKCT